jgi:hypothetical protein
MTMTFCEYGLKLTKRALTMPQKMAKRDAPMINAGATEDSKN